MNKLVEVNNLMFNFNLNMEIYNVIKNIVNN